MRWLLRKVRLRRDMGFQSCAQSSGSMVYIKMLDSKSNPSHDPARILPYVILQQLPFNPSSTWFPSHCSHDYQTRYSQLDFRSAQMTYTLPRMMRLLLAAPPRPATNLSPTVARLSSNSSRVSAVHAASAPGTALSPANAMYNTS